jgi:hypothetical protein
MEEGRLMSNPSPFDHRPDEELGAALRRALDAGHEAEFVNGLLAAANTTYGMGLPGQWWTVLTGWARPGIVAAMLLIAVVAFSLGVQMGRNSTQVTMTTPQTPDPLRQDSEQVAIPGLMAGSEAPNVDVVLAVALGR